MKAISTTCALSALFCYTLMLPAGDQTIHSEHASNSWTQTLEQYSWPEDQNVLFEPNCRELNSTRDWTPLHVAVHHGNLAIAKVLLENGALILQDANNKFPYEIELHPSAACRYVKYIEACSFLKEVQDNGHKALITGNGYFAALWARQDFTKNPNMRDTLALGAYPTSLHGKHVTPLHVAVAYGDLPFTRELLKRGALLLRNKLGLFPHKAHSAYSVHNQGYLQTKLLARIVFETLCPIHIAALDYDSEMVDTLAKMNPAYVHAEDQFGRTPLIYLAQSHVYRDQEKHSDESLLAVVKVLLARGAKAGREDTFGKSAYTYLASSESASIVRDEILELLN